MEKRKRCIKTLPDHTRCLRSALAGSNYCRAHQPYIALGGGRKKAGRKAAHKFALKRGAAKKGGAIKRSIAKKASRKSK